MLAEKKAELEQGKRDYEAGQAELKEKRTELEQGKKDLETAREELNAKREELAEGKQKLEEAREQLEEGREELNAKREELAEGKKQLKEARAELEKKRAELEDGKKQAAEARTELEGKRAELEDGKKQAAEGRAELEEKREEYNRGLQEYEEARRTLDNARSQLAQLENGTWAVRNNRGDVSFVYCSENSSNLSSLSGTFSLLFILIAALVIYASVGRMVDEQSVLVGTTKALGLLRKEILVKYMIFGILGTMLGVLAGILIAYFVLEPLILNMYAPYYLLPKARARFLLVPTLIVVLGGLLLAILAVYIACNRLLKMTAVDLMKGTDTDSKIEKKEKKEKKGKKGKEKKQETDDDEGSMMPGLILRNMSTDIKRVIVTVISIMGCCTLLVVGFTLKYGEDRIVDRQYGGVMSFDAELEYAPETPTAEAELADVLDSMGRSYIRVQKSANAFIWNDELSGGNLVCAEPDSLPGYWKLVDAETKEALALPDQGLVIPKRMHEYFGIENGDTLTLLDSNMLPHEALVSGVFDNYFGRTIFASPQAYREIFGTDAKPNCFYVRLGECEASALNEAVKDTDGFLILTDAASGRAQIQETAKALNVLIIVMIIIAGLMAFFILFNLSGSYMIHKQRELTVMRINGFTTKETKDYASTELIITSLIGILLGLPVGALLGYLTIRLSESCDMQIVRSVDARSLIFSALITALFAAFINGMALKKIKNLKLSDI